MFQPEYLLQLVTAFLAITHRQQFHNFPGNSLSEFCCSQSGSCFVQLFEKDQNAIGNLFNTKLNIRIALVGCEKVHYRIFRFA